MTQAYFGTAPDACSFAEPLYFCFGRPSVGPVTPSPATTSGVQPRNTATTVTHVLTFDYISNLMANKNKIMHRLF